MLAIAISATFAPSGRKKAVYFFCNQGKLIVFDVTPYDLCCYLRSLYSQFYVLVHGENFSVKIIFVSFEFQT